MTHGIFPTSSRQVQAYTSSTGQPNTKAPSSARGIAIPHMHTASEYMSNSVSPPPSSTPLIVTVLTLRPIMYTAMMIIIPVR